MLDVVVLQNRNGVVYSMDCVHEPFSTTILVPEAGRTVQPCIDALQYENQNLRPIQSAQLHGNLIPVMEACAKSQALVEQKNAAKGKSLRELFYGLENLRKRGVDDIDD